MPVNPTHHQFRSSILTAVINEALEFFCETPLHSLPPPSSFHGVGVYALYYVGDYAPYEKIAIANKNSYGSVPIYVGKAVPEGWRQGRLQSDSASEKLSLRLNEHARSIKDGADLAINEFQCRFIILNGVESDLISTVESALIRKFTPLWNAVVDGFGNHDPGSGRYDQAKSEWDILHPGRTFATRLRGTSAPKQQILDKIARYSTRAFKPN